MPWTCQSTTPLGMCSLLKKVQDYHTIHTLNLDPPAFCKLLRCAATDVPQTRLQAAAGTLQCPALNKKLMAGQYALTRNANA